ncbi:FAD/NAD(P)-binding domain-containing protein [Rickenella mellea]|uniref:FAD/NAD(P)-binding domain-containing protein n=1 Tax=Rickenella mellea TaxID=50990 RepID=A0A4Y7Q336_9AGAM|nr:FAD/NAD(P)-binding domain-containing protein [Rickenella mellea]
MTFAAIDPQVSLPTIDKLRFTIPPDLDAAHVAAQWFASFSRAIASTDAASVVDLLAEDAFWRDVLALTWDFRTIQRKDRILSFLNDVLPDVKLGELKIKDDHGKGVEFQQPFPDLAWIQVLFTFETSVGIGSGVVRLIPIPPTSGSGSGSSSSEWKAHSILTNLEDLKNHPEHIGHLRSHSPTHGNKWLSKRQRELDFAAGERQPRVVVIGAGQSGLDVAARLKALDVPTLVVENEGRVGSRWRERYEALCLHDPVWYDHMPYIPFPPTWPTYTPAKKLADWLESYAHSLELNIWTNSTVTSLSQDSSLVSNLDKPGKGAWTITIKRGDANGKGEGDGEGEERTFQVDHVVFAVGLGGGVPVMPRFPGMDEFKGKVVHSSSHKSALEHAGKKVVVVGACTSAHDIAADCVECGVDVTMYQRSSTYIMSVKNGIPILLGLYTEDGPPTDIADRISASFPVPFLKLMAQRLTSVIAEADKETLEGLEKSGFKLNYGEDGSGFFILAWRRAGGYYFDVGASQMIVDGKIKLKNDAQIARFTKGGIQFDDGSEVPADVVIFATGYGDAREPARKLIGDKLADKLLPVWGLNDEGEINSVWRWSGVPGLYFMMGNLALCRFHSKHVALQIKAIEEGVFGNHYTKRS